MSGEDFPRNRAERRALAKIERRANGDPSYGVNRHRVTFASVRADAVSRAIRTTPDVPRGVRSRGYRWGVVALCAAIALVPVLYLVLAVLGRGR